MDYEQYKKRYGSVIRQIPLEAHVDFIAERDTANRIERTLLKLIDLPALGVKYERRGDSFRVDMIAYPYSYHLEAYDLALAFVMVVHRGNIHPLPNRLP